MGTRSTVPLLVCAHIEVGNVCTVGFVPAKAPLGEALSNGVTRHVRTVSSVCVISPIVATVVARLAEQLVVAAVAEDNLDLPVLGLLGHPALAATAPSFRVGPGEDHRRREATNTFLSAQTSASNVGSFCAAVEGRCADDQERDGNREQLQEGNRDHFLSENPKLTSVTRELPEKGGKKASEPLPRLTAS